MEMKESDDDTRQLPVLWKPSTRPFDSSAAAFNKLSASFQNVINATNNLNNVFRTMFVSLEEYSDLQKFAPPPKKNPYKRVRKMNRKQRRSLMNGKRRGIGNTRQFSSKRARDKYGTRCIGEDLQKERLKILNTLEILQSDLDEESETPVLDAATAELGLSEESLSEVLTDEENLDEVGNFTSTELT